MKKMLMGVLAMLLVLMMGTTVFAAPSPAPDNALDQKAQEWDSKLQQATVTGTNNQIYTVTKKKVDASKVNSVNEVIKTYSSQAEVIGMSDLSVDKSVDMSKGIKVTLSIDPKSIINGYSVYVVHQYGDGKWEIIKPSSVSSDGKVTVTLYSLSPVAVVQYPNSVSVPTSDPSKNQSDSSNNTNNNTTSSESNKGNNTNSNNTSGPSQSNSNSSNSSNSNNQNNNQSNNQNNPVNVKQNVTVNYPNRDSDSYDNGYSNGYSDGRHSVVGTSASNGGAASGGTTSAGVLSPKTGASLPALPIVAVFALAGIAVCGKKANANR